MLALTGACRERDVWSMVTACVHACKKHVMYHLIKSAIGRINRSRSDNLVLRAEQRYNSIAS